MRILIRITNRYSLSNYVTSKFISLLQKALDPYEYLDDWVKLNEMSLHEKEEFYTHLYIKDITNGDYTHTKRVWKGFEIKNLVEHNDFFVQSNALLLPDVFENFKKHW